MDVNGNIVTKNAQYGYCLLDVELSTGNKPLIEWSFTTPRLKGCVGYGITTYPFQIDVENFRLFGADTMMIHSWYGVIYGGKTANHQSTIHPPGKLKWSGCDKIKFIFDPKVKVLSMQKV